jgi:hypothetical protein
MTNDELTGLRNSHSQSPGSTPVFASLTFDSTSGGLPGHFVVPMKLADQNPIHASAGHYGFTGEELDFNLNYDIKYRLGRSTREKEEA